MSEGLIFAEPISLLIGIIGGEGAAALVERLKNYKEQKRLIKTLTTAVQAEFDLSNESKKELILFFEDKRFLSVILKAAIETSSGSLSELPKSEYETDKTQLIKRWNSATRGLSNARKGKIWARLKIAIMDAVLQYLPKSEQLVHYKFDYLVSELTHLQHSIHETSQLSETYKAAIDEFKCQLQQSKNDLCTLLESLVKEASEQGLGTLSVDDRVNSYLPEMLDTLTRDGCEGREEEIKLINNFIWNQSPNCAQWWWWQGEAWSGKTTLMAHLAKNPVSNTSIASVFIIGRESVNADSDSFYTHMIPQLAKIANLAKVEIPSDVQGRIAQLKRLVHAAATKMKLTNGWLVLLIDGLDEDQSIYQNKQSIARSIPESLLSNVRIIISSRCNPPLPIDVPDTHPLRNPEFKHILKKSKIAQASKKIAMNELKQIAQIEDKQGRKYGLDILAFLTASGGWLTTNDLVELTGKHISTIEEVLCDGTTARSFKTKQLTNMELGYSLGHDLIDQLLVCKYIGMKILPPLNEGTDSEIEADGVRYIRERFLALKEWRQIIVNWAKEYTKLNWPSTTPDYLCSDAFAHLLSSDADLEEQALSIILTNQSRMLLLRTKYGNDYKAITQLRIYIERVSDRITEIPSESLTRLVTAKHFYYQLHERTLHIPINLPATLALLGKNDNAISLALSIGNAEKQVQALCLIARVLRNN